jgi:AraC family transcriptional regulator, ethanolamine operon transcriptional activator
MTRIIFKDFDEFADAINGLTGRFVPTARSQSDWWIQVVPIGRLPLQQLQTGGPTTFAGDGADQALTIGIPTSVSQRIRVDGHGLDDSSFILVKENQPFTVGARELTRWAGITVPLDHPALDPQLVQALRTQRRSGTHVQAGLAEINAAKSLIARLCTDDGTVELIDSAATRWAEEEIMTVASFLLEAGSRAERVHTGRPRFPRERVMARALAYIEENEGRPLFMSDLCGATGVSERTLRNIFIDYFGVGPMRLLKVRQLREIRAALIAAELSEQRVASVAAHFGVWDLSAFARNYKALYGETPSTTLRARPGTRRHDSTLSTTWLRYASRTFSASAAVRRG